jgi:GxxExxY protein
MALQDISCRGNGIHRSVTAYPIFLDLLSGADTVFNHQAQHTAMKNVSGIPIVEDDYEKISKCSPFFYTQQIHFTNEVPVPRIEDVEALDRELPELCSSIFDALSSKELEATFQHCLALDLTEAGIQIEQEVEIQLTYKGRRVGSRRADIVLQVPSDGQRIVLELKAVGTLTSEHLKQLQFYMHHLHIDKGYLINFPHDTGFPDIPAVALDGSVFKHEVILGDPTQLSNRSTRGRHANAMVQIIKVVRSQSRSISTLFVPPVAKVGISSSIKAGISSSVDTVISSRFQVPIAKTTGMPCKLCTKSQAYCRFHVRSTGTASSVDTVISSRFQVPIAKSTGMPCKLCTKSQAYCRFHVSSSPG